MRKMVAIWLLCLLFAVISLQPANAQCSICAKTTQQLGERPAKALNAGIIYLAIAPLAILGIVGYKWWKHNGSGPQ